MRDNDFTRVGRVKDAHSLKGEIFVSLKAGQADWLGALEELRLILPSGEPKDFTVEAARAHKEGLIVALKGVADRTQAEAFKGSWVEITNDYLSAEPGERFFLRELLGRELIDQKLGLLGPIVGLSSNGPQDLLVVETRKGRFEIPLVDQFIVGVEGDKKILMDLPEGLVEV